MLFLCHFWDWLHVVWFLDMALFAPKPTAAKALATGRERERPPRGTSENHCFRPIMATQFSISDIFGEGIPSSSDKMDLLV